MAENKSQSWKENANSLLVIYSILAATCGVIIALVFQDSQSVALSTHWWIPVPLLAISFWCFIFSADALTTAIDEDDVEKYLALLVFYNLAIVCLFSGLFFAVYYHYIANWMLHQVPARLERWAILFVACIIISFHWLKDVYWLLFANNSEYQDHIQELCSIKKLPYDRKSGWSGLFLWLRKNMHKAEKGYQFKETIIELQSSKINGIGVFAARDIKKGEVVAEGIHTDDYADLVPWSVTQTLDIDTVNRINAYCIGTPIGFFPPPDYDFNQLSVEWFMNHSCDGNLGFNENGDFIAIKNIRKNGELTYDYGLAESNPNFQMKCDCKNVDCRKTITGNDWKEATFREKKFNFLLPALREN